jgi:two-component system sensor histidine kinase VicK
VAAAALSVALRGERLAGSPWARAALAVGFGALAVAAFLHGSLQVDEGGAGSIVAFRSAGVLGVGAGGLGWAGGSWSRRLLWAGLGLVAGATGLDVVGAGTATAARAVVALGAAALGASLALATRRSIAARVATSAAATLLVVVLVLSVALSAVLSSTIEQGETSRLQARVGNEADEAGASFAGRLADAKVVAASLAADTRALVPLAEGPASNAVSPQLAQLSSRFLSDVSLAYVARSGALQGVVGLDPATAVALAGSDVVGQAIQAGAARGSVSVVGERALTVGVQPVLATVNARPQLLGVALAVSPLDLTYLRLASNDDPNLSLALAGRRGLASAHGPQPASPTVEELARAVLDGGRARSAIVGSRFVAVAPVRAGDGRPVLAMVASVPTTLVSDTRRSLFRSLFLIALGGTLLALLLASLVSRRLGAGLGRLTTAAEGIRRGDLGVRADVLSDDEVGALGAPFNSMAASVQDMTVAESRLRARLEAVVGGMGEALVATDTRGLVTDFNHAAVDLVGLDAGQARGRPVDQVLVVVDEGGSQLVPASLGSTQGRWSDEAWVQREDGARVPVALSAAALVGGNDEALGTVWVLRDLRRERQVEEMKSQFLSRVGHELRTPLTAIMASAGLLADGRVPARQARAWNTEIVEQSKSLLRVVEMLEFFASSAAGRVSLQPRALDVRTVLEGVVRRWQARLEEAGGTLAIRRRVAKAVPRVVADQRWLTLCLDELVDNAVKFSPGGGTITVSAVPADGGGVEMTVADRGKGMSGDEQAEAFGDFVQGDASDTRRYGGLGLGLAMVRRVVEAHGGTVSCRSTPGKGSTFSFVVPAQTDEAGR